MTDLQQEGAEGNAIEQKPTDAPVETPKTEVETTEAPKEEVKAEKTDEPWPKKAVNALSKRERQIGKLRAELEAMKQQAAQYQQPQSNVKKNEPPKAENFQDYESYIDAKTEWKLEQKLSERQQESVKSQTEFKEREYFAELENSFVEQVETARTKLADFEQVRLEAAEDINGLPPHITKVCLEADDGVLALYQLAKEGRISELAEMSPTKAAMTLARAGDKAKATLSQPKPVSKAPNPMTPVKGSSRFDKPVEQMSGEELMKHYGLK